MFSDRSQPPVAEVTPAEAHERVTKGEGILVDVREPDEWRGGHAAGARHIPLGELSLRAAELPRDQDIYLICASGNRSKVAATLLGRAGFASPASVRGGTASWARAGLPLERS
jgi:rhodanese-related sulfurtransferase